MTTGRRVHERYVLALPVTIVHAGGETSGSTRNVSLGGMLIGVPEHTIAFGSNVKLRLLLSPLKEDALMSAIVRWISPGAVGVQFGSLRAREVWALNLMFKDAPILAS